MIQLTSECQASFKSHVLTEYPNEACGLVVNDTYIPCTNSAETPATHFRIPANELLAATENGPIQVVLHSHTYSLGDNVYANGNQPEWPSTADMTTWMQDNIPWGIVATDGEGLSEMVWMDESEVAPLLERPFIHGVWDCGSIIRDYFRTVHGLTINNYARGYEWWNNGKNLYVDNWADAGFTEITTDEATIGDVCIMQVRSPVPNHAAVITADNTITHHLFHRLSEEDRLDKWRRVIVKYLRYTGKQE